MIEQNTGGAFQREMSAFLFAIDCNKRLALAFTDFIARSVHGNRNDPVCGDSL